MKRTIGTWIWVGAALALVSLPVAATAALPKGAEEFHAGWRAAATPQPGPKKQITEESRQRARLAAIPKMEAAVAADPANPKYRTALVYLLLSSSQYRKAKESVDAAIKRERRDPLLYLMRAQAEAALAQSDPAKASQKIGPAVEALDRAADLDKDNSLPLLQAVSIALDLDRLDLALPRLDRALTRPACRLYSLPIPFDLEPDRAASVRMWQQLQYAQWFTLLARCQNAERGVIRLGDQEAKAGNADAAESRYQQAREIARMVGRTEPYTFIAVGTSIDMLSLAYPRLAGVARGRNAEATQRAEAAKKAGEDTAAWDQQALQWKIEADRWDGERGVVEIGAGELQGVLAVYQKQLGEDPPASLEEMFLREAMAVQRVMAGIGLEPKRGEPAGPQVPAGKPAAHAAPRGAGAAPSAPAPGG